MVLVEYFILKDSDIFKKKFPYFSFLVFLIDFFLHLVFYDKK